MQYTVVKSAQTPVFVSHILYFISDYCYQDEPADYGDDGELANELVFFSEAWEKLSGWDSYGKIADTFQTAAVLSLIDGAFHDSMAADRISEAAFDRFPRKIAQAPVPRAEGQGLGLQGKV